MQVLESLAHRHGPYRVDCPVAPFNVLPLPNRALQELSRSPLPAFRRELDDGQPASVLQRLQWFALLI